MMAVLRHKESIHSGQFMVSNLEPEEDYGEETGLDVGGEEGLIRDEVVSDTRDKAVFQSVFCPGGSNKADKRIDNSLSKLFSCMSKVYAHKLSSPKWNRFLGLKLRWKDKIRYVNQKETMSARSMCLFQIKQFDMAMLAHAVYRGKEEACVRLCESPGGRGPDTRGGGRGHADDGPVLEAEDGHRAGRVQELADILQESSTSAQDMSPCQHANSGPG